MILDLLCIYLESPEMLAGPAEAGLHLVRDAEAAQLTNTSKRAL